MEVGPVLARLQPVDSASIRNVFLSAIIIATSSERKSQIVKSFPSELKVAAQEQVLSVSHLLLDRKRVKLLLFQLAAAALLTFNS